MALGNNGPKIRSGSNMEVQQADKQTNMKEQACGDGLKAA